ncbi:hypothetical protein LTR94_029284, partial [Friedmanniomyces endolithicus]
AAWDEPQSSALSQGDLDKLTEDLIVALKTVFDPEIPVDIYELGLIYRVDVSDDRDVVVDMTLTAPGCPVAGEMPGWVESAVEKVEGVRSAKANLVFDPPWDASKMSDEAKLAVTLTDAAAERVREILDNADNAHIGLRIGIKNGGCAGQEYTFAYADTVEPMDEVVEDKGVTILIEPKAVLFLIGTEIDYEVTKLASKFVFRNPNETDAC